MTTGADEIVDRFLMIVEKDSTLNTIYNTSGSTILTNYVEAWLLKAIDDFARVSTEDLTYTQGSGSAVGFFTATLTERAKNILSTIVQKYWLQQHVNNANAFGRFFRDKEFSMTAPMLPALREYLIVVTESVDKLLSDYAWDNGVNWDNWFNQNYYSSS